MLGESTWQGQSSEASHGLGIDEDFAACRQPGTDKASGAGDKSGLAIPKWVAHLAHAAHGGGPFLHNSFSVKVSL